MGRDQASGRWRASRSRASRAACRSSLRASRSAFSALRTAFWLIVYGTYANWLTTLLGAAWGAGGRMMPIAAAGFEAGHLQESVVTFGLLSLSLAMVAGSGLVLWGLSRSRATTANAA